MIATAAQWENPDQVTERCTTDGTRPPGALARKVGTFLRNVRSIAEVTSNSSLASQPSATTHASTWDGSESHPYQPTPTRPEVAFHLFDPSSLPYE